MADIYKIVPKPTITILGFILSDSLKNDCQINSLASNLHHKMKTLRDVLKYASQKSRINFLNSIVIGKLNYLLPLLNNCSSSAHSKLHKIVMTAARTGIGNYCYKQSVSKILRQCKFMNIDQMIKVSCLKFAHSLILNRIPESTYNLLKLSRRPTAEIILFKPLESKLARTFHLYNGLQWYNKLPNSLKDLSIFKFKVQIKKYILDNG